MSDCKFEFYVLNYDFNRRKVENYNIFDNWRLNDSVFKEVGKYVRSPKNYVYKEYRIEGDKEHSGFDGLCIAIDRDIAWQEWSRCEYEISVGPVFCSDLNYLEKWDCYAQAKPNVPIIARECIRQYKEYKKGKKNEAKEN